MDLQKWPLEGGSEKTWNFIDAEFVENMLNIEACKTLIFATRHERKSIFTRFKGPENLPKTKKYDAKLMLKKVGKIDAKMAPKMKENASKNRSGVAIGLQILDFGGFWSYAKI